MKTIGLIGGMSWESSIEYYRIINEEVNNRLGGLHSAKLIMFSFDFDYIESLQTKGKWAKATEVMIDAAKSIEKAGAELILICTNTMHKMFDEVEANISVPLLHIIDAAAEAIKSKSLEKVGLFGTMFTMEDDFYRDRLMKKHGVSVIIPDSSDRKLINYVIYKELCVGQINEASKYKLKNIIQKLIKDGAEGIVLGCTELPLLLKEEDSTIPLFDTCNLHAKKAVEIALED
jgi:aspartate racemase